MPSAARRSLLVAPTLLAFSALLAGCGTSAECVIDSDCTSLAQRCEANACVPLGVPPVDLGVVDLGRRDGAPTDGAPADGAPDDGSVLDAGAPSTLTGAFTADSNPSGYTVSASFTETPTTPPGPCTTRDEGPCKIMVCTPAASTAIPRSAGSLMLSGGASTITIAANVDDTYTPSTGAGPLFSGGAVLTFDASGNDPGIPTFSGTVTTPNMATLTTPAIVDATPLAVSRVDDLSLGWTPSGPTGMVEANFIGADATGSFATARCRFMGTAFSGAVPAAAFSGFPTGATGSYSFFIENETEVSVAGGWTVTLGARSPLLTASGAASTGPATF